MLISLMRFWYYQAYFPMASATLAQHVLQALGVIREHNIAITCIYIDAFMALMLSKAVIDL